MMITPGGDIHEYCPDCRGVCKQVRPAPSVAGTQPTCDFCENKRCSHPLMWHKGRLVHHATGKSGYYPCTRFTGAAQGTPQVEQISREIAEKLVAMHLIVWQGLGQAMDEYAKETSVILRKHGVGAPAQPGPEESSTFYDECEYCHATQQPHDPGCPKYVEPETAQGTPEPPKVEELARQIYAICPVLNGKIRPEFEDIAALLRLYFPPASQTHSGPLFAPKPDCPDCRGEGWKDRKDEEYCDPCHCLQVAILSGERIALMLPAQLQSYLSGDAGDSNPSLVPPNTADSQIDSNTVTARKICEALAKTKSNNGWMKIVMNILATPASTARTDALSLHKLCHLIWKRKPRSQPFLFWLGFRPR